MLPPELIAKLNECASARFVALRDASLFWQTVFSRIVIAGLLFEGPELVHEMLSIIGNWFPNVGTKFPRFKVVISSKGFIEYAKLAAFLGWILIIVGLGGELRTSASIVDFSARIEECSDAKVTKATLEAGDAAQSAKSAREEAETAKTAAGIAIGKSDRATAVASRALGTSKEATNAASEAEDRVDEVTEQSDKLDRKIWQTQLWLSGRTIIDVNSFFDIFKKFEGKEIVLASYVGDPEAERICDALFNAAAIAKMKTTNHCAKEALSVPVQTGTLIFGPDNNEIKEFMGIIAQAITGGAGGMLPQPGSTLTVLVGKLEPFTMDSRQLFSPPPIREKIKRQHKKP
jgi:hypothetical protein